MMYDVTLCIQEVATGICSEAHLQVDVTRAESGLYIASNMHVAPIIAASTSPRFAIVEYLGYLFYTTTTEAEQQGGEG